MLFCLICFCLARQNLPCARVLNYVLKWRLLEVVVLMWRHLSLLNTRINSVVVHFATIESLSKHDGDGSENVISKCNFAFLQSIFRELKQPRRRRQQKPHKFAYLTMENNIFARFARAYFIF